MAPARAASRVLAVVVVLATSLWLGAPAAQAHTFLVGSNPADGQLLDVAPTLLRLDFSESVVLGATQVVLTDGQGGRIRPTSISVADGATQADTEQPVQVVVGLPELGRGTYRVAWKTLSADDLHQASGVLAFGVGERVGAAGSVEEAPGLAEALTRWVMWSALAGLLGPLAVAALAGSTLRGLRLTRVVRLARASAVVLLGACLVLPAAQLRSVRQAWLAAHDPSVGAAWVLRALGAALACALVAGAVRQVSGRGAVTALRTYPVEAVGLLAALLAVPVVTGVRGHIWSSSHALAGLDVLHAVAAATWVGAVVALAVVHAGARGPRPVVPARGFALLSVTCVALAVASGFVLAGHGVATTTALRHARYGLTVVVKGALVTVVLLLALRNHVSGRRGVLGASGRAWVAAEGLLLVGVLSVAGALAATAPANSPRWTPTPAASRSLDLRADDLLVQVSIGPNAVGPAYVNARVLQTRRPAPAPVRTVQITLQRNGLRAVTGAATAQPDGTWALPVQLPEAGPWRVTVQAQRAGLLVARADGTWVVDGGVHGPGGRVLSSLTTPGAALVIAGWLTLLIALLRARDRADSSVAFPTPTRRPDPRPRPIPHPSWSHRTPPVTVSPHSPGGAGSPGVAHGTGGAGGTDHRHPAPAPTGR